MPKCCFANFDITIRGSQPPYSVTAFYRNQAAEGEFHQDASQEFWRASIQKLESSLVLPDAAAIEEAGGRLFDDLFQGDVRDLWIVARSDLENELENHVGKSQQSSRANGKNAHNGHFSGLRIRLMIRPPAVAALPWESLFDRDRNSAFAASGRTPVVRVENLLRYIGRPRPLTASLPLKILVAAPEDPTGIIDPQEEIGVVQTLLANFAPETIQVSLLKGRITITDLRRRMQQVQPDILHILTHGAPDGLLFWRRDQPVTTSAAALRVTLERNHSVKLVVLNACLAGQGSTTRAFNSVATQLLQAGAPAVVAMQFEIRDDAAVEFAHFLYEELVGDECPGAIDSAVGNARSSLFALYPGDFTFGTPVLWLNADHGQVFDLDQAQPEEAGQTGRKAQAQPTPRSLPEYINIYQEDKWLADHRARVRLLSLPKDDPFVTIIQDEWQKCADALEDLLIQLRYLEENGSLEEYRAKARDYHEQKAALLRLSQTFQDLHDRNSKPSSP